MPGVLQLPQLGTFSIIFIERRRYIPKRNFVCKCDRKFKHVIFRSINIAYLFRCLARMNVKCRMDRVAS